MKRKRILFTVLSVVFTVAVLVVFSISAFAAETSLGDINGDGMINASDARKILRHSAQVELLTDAQMPIADIDGNGKITASDARIALRISAMLDDINNYTGGTTEDPKPVDPPSADGKDLSVYLNASIDDVLAVYPDAVVNEDIDYLYCTDSLYFAVDENGYVVDICIVNECDENIMNIGYGTTVEDAEAAITAGGFNEFGYNADLETFIGYYSDGSYVEYVEYFSKAMYDYDKDLGLYIGFPVEFINIYFTDLVQDTEDTSYYYNDSVGMYVDPEFDCVSDVYIFDESDASVYGITYGMSADKVSEIADSWDFVITDDGYYENELYNEYLYIEYDENNNVIMINLWADLYYEDDYYTDGELSDFLWSSGEYLTEAYPEFEYVPAESDEYYDYYYADNVYCLVKDGYIFEIDIMGDSSFSIFGTTPLITRANAIDLLERNGYDYADMDGCSLIVNDYYLGRCYLANYDYDGTVNSVCIFNNDYEMSFYLGTSIDDLYAEIPDLKQIEDEDIYESEYFLFAIDESGTVIEAAVKADCCAYAYGVFYGCDMEIVPDIIEYNGFTIYEDASDSENIYATDGYGNWLWVYTEDGQTVSIASAFIPVE